MFRKMISYIYDEETGRGGNLGVVKTQIREVAGKMQILLEKSVPSNSQVGFYVWESETAKCCLCHNLSEEISFDARNVAGMGFEELGGVIMRLGERICVAEWQDREFDFAKIRWMESLESASGQFSANPEIAEVQEDMLLVAQSIPEEEPAIKPTKQSSAPERIEIPDFLKRKKKDKAYRPPINNWKDMFKYYDIVEPFCDGMIYCCVEIGADDLKYLPSSCKNAVKNSFLLHGFYLHKHLLIGKYKCKKRQKVYVLGVPGNYENSETLVAAMFGFDNFKKAKREGVPDANFGYWYTLFKDDEINE